MLTLSSFVKTEYLKNLRVGDTFLVTGTIYTARDAAHKKLVELIEKKQELPFKLKGSIVYYTGPSPAKPGKVIGSCGPTTSGRMDAYTPQILKQGVKIVIGKGGRSLDVRDVLKKEQAIYCAATGGAGALLAEKVVKSEVIAFPELGPEAIHRLEVKDFPVTVINDLAGNDLYEEARKNYSGGNIK